MLAFANCLGGSKYNACYGKHRGPLLTEIYHYIALTNNSKI